jgi:1,4-alpha-glucan branching enzyme
MSELAKKYKRAEGIERRALNQMARELLLAESSDWAFMMKTRASAEYAVRRTRDHLLAFIRLYESLQNGAIDEAWLEDLERKDCIFPQMDYRVYA